MKVPLIMEAVGDKLHLTTNGKHSVLKLPLKPYLIAENENKYLKSEPVQLTRIPDGKLVTMRKMSAPSIDELERRVRQLSLEKEKFHRLPYMEQLYADQPAFPLQYPNTDELKLMYLDIEVLTVGDGVFPRANKSPIIAIGAAVNNGETRIFDDYNTAAKKTADKQILEDFINYYEEEDPDVIVTYNGEWFDLPYIVTRMQINGIDPKRLNRNKGELIYRGDIRLRGRIHFDCIHPARKDQSMFGIKTRGLKDVSKWYGFDAQDFGEDIANTQKHVNSPELREYLTSDIEATRVVSKVYFPNSVTLAELLQVPLGSIIGCYSSFIPKLICARNCNKLGLMPLENNIGRYGNVDPKTKAVTSKGRLATFGSKYEGAIVNIKKTGYFPQINKVDFASQYPSAIRTWNLGPDTTRLVEFKDYTGEYKFVRTRKDLTITIPDKNFNKDIVVNVDMSKPGFLKEEIERLAAERKAIKKQMRETKDKDEESSLNSRQIAIKVIMNSIYGYLGSKYATYGDMMSALVVTGMCRWTTSIAIDEVGDQLIETDTDGMVVEGKVDYNSINDVIASEIMTHQRCNSFMILEEEPLRDAYFYKMKNYVVREEHKGELLMEKHGCAFKSSKQAPVCDKILDELCRLVLDRNLDDQFSVAERMRNLKQYKLSDFKYRVTFSKSLEGYGEGLSQQRVLGVQIQHRLKQDVEEGLQVDYYVTKEPPNCPPLAEIYKKAKRTKGPYYTIGQYVTSVDQLDENYYIDQINKLFVIFNWKADAQLDMFE